MNKRQTYNNLCVVDTEYALFLYLVATPFSEIKKTFYILGPDISDDIRANISDALIVRCPKFIRNRFFLLLYYRFFFLFRIPNCKYIFCQDHLPFSSIVIKNKIYTLIEDSPDFFTNYYQSQRKINDDIFSKSVKGKIFALLFGDVIINPCGKSNRCVQFLLSQDNTSISRNKNIVNISQVWSDSSTEKRDYILSLFGLTINDVSNLQKRKIILFTQPLFEFKGISKEHQISIYRKIISNYHENDMIIKTHPRDDITYEDYFPQCSVFRKSVPSQLLDAIGVRYEKAVTIFSSAAAISSYKIEVDWYGTEVDPLLYAIRGHIVAPKLESLNIISNDC